MARITGRETLHRGWATLTRLTIEDGGQTFYREMEDHGDSAAVLPYDPKARTAVLVRLLRAPKLDQNGDGMALEVPAGLVDEGESFEDAAQREALEETGIRLAALEHVSTAWPAAGVSRERAALFLAPFGPADRIAEGGGIATEHENITVVELPLRDLWAMMTSGELSDLRSIALLMALRHRRPELFD